MFPKRGNLFPFLGIQGLQRLSLDSLLLFFNHCMDASTWHSNGFPNGSQYLQVGREMALCDTKGDWAVRMVKKGSLQYPTYLPSWLPILTTVLISARADGRPGPKGRKLMLTSPNGAWQQQDWKHTSSTQKAVQETLCILSTSVLLLSALSFRELNHETQLFIETG